jgi:hypothetical protein
MPDQRELLSDYLVLMFDRRARVMPTMISHPMLADVEASGVFDKFREEASRMRDGGMSHIRFRGPWASAAIPPSPAEPTKRFGVAVPQPIADPAKCS